MHPSTTYVVAVAVGALVAVSGARGAAEDAAKEHTDLAKGLSAAKVSLRRGLSAAATTGNTEPEAVGLRAIRQGFGAVGRDDADIAARATFLHDSPCAHLRREEEGVRSMPPGGHR